MKLPSVSHHSSLCNSAVIFSIIIFTLLFFSHTEVPNRETWRTDEAAFYWSAVADPRFAKGGQTMASVEHEPIMGVWGKSPQQGSAAEGVKGEAPWSWKLFVHFQTKRGAKNKVNAATTSHYFWSMGGAAAQSAHAWICQCWSDAIPVTQQRGAQLHLIQHSITLYKKICKDQRSNLISNFNLKLNECRQRVDRRLAVLTFPSQCPRESAGTVDTCNHRTHYNGYLNRYLTRYLNTYLNTYLSTYLMKDVYWCINSNNGQSNLLIVGINATQYSADI